MLNNDLSDAMKKQVEKLVEKIGNDSIVANITMTFTSPKFPEYKVYLCREIQSLSIHQDFVKNITDKITAELLLEKDTYVGMLYMRKNLFCQLEITFVHPEQVFDNNQYKRKPDYSEKFKVMLTKWEDLFKKFSTEQLFPEKRRENASDHKLFNMSIELLMDDVFKARKQAFYITGRDTTMKQMVRYAINYFGFKKAHISTISNTKQYTNFVIPPAYGVEEVMSYLQNGPGLGIFKDGLISYIQNHCWYVYPRYGEPLNKCPIHVYCLGGGRFEGMSRNDWEEGNQTASPVTGKFPLHIISPFEMKEDSWISKGTENEYTSIVAHMSDLVIDASRTLVNDEKTVLNRNTHYPTVVPPDIMDYDNFIRIKHVKSHGNLFKLCSEARSLQCRTLSFKWKHARPWVFQPATAVYVHYDDHGKMDEGLGICEMADYTFTRDKEGRTEPVWTCEGNFDICCSVRGEKLTQSKR